MTAAVLQPGRTGATERVSATPRAAGAGLVARPLHSDWCSRGSGGREHAASLARRAGELLRARARRRAARTSGAAPAIQSADTVCGWRRLRRARALRSGPEQQHRRATSAGWRSLNGGALSASHASSRTRDVPKSPFEAPSGSRTQSDPPGGAPAHELAPPFAARAARVPLCGHRRQALSHRNKLKGHAAAPTWVPLHAFGTGAHPQQIRGRHCVWRARAHGTYWSATGALPPYEGWGAAAGRAVPHAGVGRDVKAAPSPSVPVRMLSLPFLTRLETPLARARDSARLFGSLRCFVARHHVH